MKSCGAGRARPVSTDTGVWVPRGGRPGRPRRPGRPTARLHWRGPHIFSCASIEQMSLLFSPLSDARALDRAMPIGTNSAPKYPRKLLSGDIKSVYRCCPEAGYWEALSVSLGPRLCSCASAERWGAIHLWSASTKKYFTRARLSSTHCVCTWRGRCFCPPMKP